MKPWSTRRNLLSGSIGLALAALLAAPATPLGAGEEKEKGKEQREEGPRPGPARQAPGQRPGMANQAPGQRPSGRNQAPGQRPGMANQAPGQRPGMPGPHPGMPGQAGRPGPGLAPHAGPPPMTVVRTRDGGEIHRGPGGAIREVRTPGGAVIHYAPNGMRHVEVVRPDGRVFVANGSGRGGYVQRPFMVHNQAFVQRTYVEHGVVFTRVYRPYVYRGVTFNVYMPVHYYRPAYYSWAYRPWGQPVRYGWGWGGQPWYGYYGGYYAPYPVYASPVFWLTDFMMAATLQAAYQARLDNPAPAPAPVAYDNSGMTPEVKQAIADEVRRQVDEERLEQQQAMGQSYTQPASAPPPLFADNVSRIFLVATSTVAYAGGQERDLSEGTVLQLNGAPAPDATTADVVVLASRDRAVPRGSVVTVSLQDLQEMQNHMRATIDQGLGDLQAKQGQDGLPPVPPQNLGTSDAPFAGAVQADPNAAGELSQVAAEANASGQSTLDQQPQAPPPPTGGTIALGMTADQVHRILGTPKDSANLGSKRIEVYQDFKVTYSNGSVTNIQ